MPDRMARAATTVDEAWIKMIVPGEAAQEVVAGTVALWSHDEDGGEREVTFAGRVLRSNDWVINPATDLTRDR